MTRAKGTACRASIVPMNAIWQQTADSIGPFSSCAAGIRGVCDYCGRPRSGRPGPSPVRPQLAWKTEVFRCPRVVTAPVAVPPSPPSARTATTNPVRGTGWSAPRNGAARSGPYGRSPDRAASATGAPGATRRSRPEWRTSWRGRYSETWRTGGTGTSPAGARGTGAGHGCGGGETRRGTEGRRPSEVPGRARAGAAAETAGRFRAAALRWAASCRLR